MQMCLISSHSNICFQSMLDESGCREVIDALEVDQRIVHWTVSHKKPHTQSRHQHFGERAYIDHTSVWIERFERRLCASLVTQVAHKVIFQNWNVISICQYKQLP